MEAILYSTLPSLAKELQFRVEKLTGTDYYYTDGLAVGSVLKLMIHRSSCEIPVYIYRSCDFSVLGTLTVEERSILEGWLNTVKSRKIE